MTARPIDRGRIIRLREYVDSDDSGIMMAGWQPIEVTQICTVSHMTSRSILDRKKTL